MKNGNKTDRLASTKYSRRERQKNCVEGNLKEENYLVTQSDKKYLIKLISSPSIRENEFPPNIQQSFIFICEHFSISL